MKLKNIPYLLIIIFLLAIGIRLYIAFQTPHFSDDDAYFTLRQVENIRDTGTPLYNDDLSYGGRTYVFLPVFHYILAFFSFFFSTAAVAKIIPNIFASSLVLIVYLIVKHLSKDDKIGLLAAFFSGFIPIFVSETINSVSAYSMTIPLTFLLLYFLLRVRMNNNIYYYILILCLFLVTSPYVILFILTMLLFFLFSWVEGFKPTRTELELTMFSLFLTVWFYFVMYREALLMHGYKIIWQNIPNEVINQYFTDIDILTILYQVGLIPIITGLIVIYYYLFKKKKKSIYFLLSLGIIIGVLLLQKHIILNVGLIYIGVLLILLLGEFMNNIITYIDQTKFSRLKNLFLLGFLILFIFTSFFHSINVAKEKVIQSDPAGKVFALQFLHNISKEGDMVIGSVFDGHLITYTSKRKNMIDTNFLQIDASERLRDLRTIYTSAIISGPIDVMRKYDADFILLTQEAKDYYKITKLAYVDDECFPVIYSGQDVQVYQRKC